MGALTTALGSFLGFAALIPLAVPSGWHDDVEAAQLVHTRIGIFRFSLQKSTLGTVATLGAGVAGKLGNKLGTDKLDGAQEKLNDVLGEGSYWIWEAREKYCAQDALGQAAQEFIPFLKETCRVWTALATASYIVAACTCIGSALLIMGSCLSRDKSKLSHGKDRLRKVGLIFGPAHGIIGVVAYFALTSDFPASFGFVYFAAAGIAVLSLAPFGVSFAESDSVPDFAKGKGDPEQAVLMANQGASYQAAAMGQQPPGMGQQQPPGMGQQHPGMGQQPPEMGQQHPGSQPQHFAMPGMPGQPPSFDPQGPPNYFADQMGGGMPQMPNSAPGRMMPPEPMAPPAPAMPLSWGVVPMGMGMGSPQMGGQYGGQLYGVGGGYSQPEFRRG